MITVAAIVRLTCGAANIEAPKAVEPASTFAACVAVFAADRVSGIADFTDFTFVAVYAANRISGIADFTDFAFVAIFAADVFRERKRYR